MLKDKKMSIWLIEWENIRIHCWKLLMSSRVTRNRLQELEIRRRMKVAVERRGQRVRMKIMGRILTFRGIMLKNYFNISWEIWTASQIWKMVKNESLLCLDFMRFSCLQKTKHQTGSTKNCYLRYKNNFSRGSWILWKNAESWMHWS